MKDEAGDESVQPDKIDNKNKTETRIYKYIGETNCSSFERGSEHNSDMRLIKTGCHMLQHVLDKHEGETLDEVDFRMKVVTFHKLVFERQINESVLIQVEYNRCQIPRISIKMGEKEIKERKKDLDNEISDEQMKDIELEKE